MADLFVIFDEEGIADRDSERTYRTYSDAFATMSEDNFIATVRLSKDAAREVCEAVKGDLEWPQQWRRTTLSVEQRVLMALRFYATGAFLGNIAREESFVCSKHALSEALHVVSLVITMNLAQVSPVPLDSSGKAGSKARVLRVGWVSWVPRRILFVNARYPGSCHDASVWAASQLCREAPTIFEDGEWLIGDSAHSLQPWLMTPVRTSTTQEEIDYNDAHSRTRVRIEHCFGMLKMRFRCLQRYRTLHFAPERSFNIINACYAESGPDDDMTEEASVAGADDAEDNDSAVATSSRATQWLWNLVTSGYKTVPLTSALQQGPQTPEQAV
ncbi:putative nuclease HARBI1 [Ornithodoros turicata]|uniref:putative nuclease HARBI1 n=1 Tax=Ornithodoros turicata TaxID=34597 RepID=UPI003138901A